MTKTLLFVNGQPVVLTTGGSTYSPIQNNPGLNDTFESHGSVDLQNGGKSLFELANTKVPHPLGTRLEEALQEVGKGVEETVKPDLLQVKVHEGGVSGFVLSQDQISQPTGQQNLNCGLLHTGNNTAFTVGSHRETEAGGFLQLHNALVQRVSTKESSFDPEGEKNCRSNVFTLTSDSQLLQPQIDGRSEVAHQEVRQVENLQNVVRLSLVPDAVPLKRHSMNEVVEGVNKIIKNNGEESQVPTSNLSTLVAIIQAENSATQTIEITPEEACKYNISQLMGEHAITEQQQLEKVQELSTVHTSHTESDHQKNYIIQVEKNCERVENCSSAFANDKNSAGTENSVCGATSDADVSLGPFLLIPEYNADGTVSMFQISGSDSDAPTETSPVNTVTSSSFCADDTQFHAPKETCEKASLLFPNAGENVQNIRIPVTPHIKRQNTTKPKHTEWKAIAPKVTPQVPGNIYLRDIAKRTKFRKLTSFLDTKQNSQDSCVMSENQRTEPITPVCAGNSVINLSNVTNTSSSLIIPTSAGYSLTSGSRRFRQNQSILKKKKVVPEKKVKDVPVFISQLPSSSCTIPQSGTVNMPQTLVTEGNIEAPVIGQDAPQHLSHQQKSLTTPILLAPNTTKFHSIFPERSRETSVKRSVPADLSHCPSSTASLVQNEEHTLLQQQHQQATCDDQALTIKVSTGPVYVQDSNTVQSSSASDTPLSSIRCTGESLAGINKQ